MLLRHTRWLFAWLVASAALLLAAGLYYSRVYVPRARLLAEAAIVDDLTVAATFRAATLGAGVADAFGDAQTVADFPSVQAALAAGFESAHERSHVEDILTRFVSRQEYGSVAVFDLAGRLAMGSGAAGASGAKADAAARAVRAQTGVALALDEAKTAGILFAVPVVDAAGGALGAVVLDEASERIDVALRARASPEGLLEFAVVDTAVAGGGRVALGGSAEAAIPRNLAALQSQGAAGRVATAAGDVFAVSQLVRDTSWVVVAATRAAPFHSRFDAGIRSIGLTWGALLLASLSALFLLVWGIRKAVEARFARSQARLTALLDRANDVILIIDQGGRIRDCNNRAVEFYGRSRAALLGQHVVDDLRAPGARESGRVQFSTVVEAGHLLFETLHQLADGREVPVEVNSSAVVLDGAPAIVSVVRDITERRQAEARIDRLIHMLRTVSEISQMIVREQDAERLIGEVCRLVVEEGRFELAWIGRKEPDGRVVEWARAGLETGPRPEVRWDDAGRGGASGTAIRDERTVVMSQVDSDARFAPRRHDLAPCASSTLASSPIRVGATVFGALSVMSWDRDAFDDDAIRLLEEIATDVGFALQALDDRAARQANEAALAEQRHLFQRITELSPVIKYLYDVRQRRNVYSNRTVTDVLRLSLRRGRGDGRPAGALPRPSRRCGAGRGADRPPAGARRRRHGRDRVPDAAPRRHLAMALRP